MSANWYPVINYQNCVSCGACVQKCQNGVYEKSQIKPQVIYPDGCIDGCRGCQKLCATGAIDYFGDKGQTPSSCNCS